MGPALPSGRRLSLRRDGKATGDRILARVETGLAPSLAARHRPGRGKPCLYGKISVTFGPLQSDFCTLHVCPQMRQDSGYPDIYLHAGPDGSCSIPILAKRVGKAKWLKPGSDLSRGCWACWRFWAPE